MTDRNMVEITVAVIVNSDGEYEVGEDMDVAAERYGDNYTYGAPTAAYTLTISVPAPIVRSFNLEVEDSKEEDVKFSLKETTSVD